MKTILVDAVGAFVIEGKGIFWPMYELLEKYPNKKIILTNANDEQLVSFGLQNMPYEVFSLKHNPDKIDPKYYEQVLRHFNLTKDEVIYFEHNPKAVESAKFVGINTYNYDNTKNDLVALGSFLDSNLLENKS